MFSSKKISCVIVGITIVSVIFPIAVFAREIRPTPLIKPDLLPGPAQTEDSGEAEPREGGAARAEPLSGRFFNTYITGFVQRYLPGFLGVIAIFAVFGIIIGGVFMMTAYGNEERIGTAKKMIQWSIIGLLIAMLAFAIVNIIVRLPLPGT